MLSVPFGQTGGKGFSLNKNLTIKNATAGWPASAADQILIWNPTTSGYETFYLYEGDATLPKGWYSAAGAEPSFDDVYKDGLPEGSAFWYLAKDSSAQAEVCASGEVNLAALATFNLVKGNFNMIANPYPQSFSLNKNMELENATAGWPASAADQILIWNPTTSGYETFYLYEGDATLPKGWYSAAGAEPSFDDVYKDGLPAGTAFWYLAHQGEGTVKVTFTK